MSIEAALLGHILKPCVLFQYSHSPAAQQIQNNESIVEYITLKVTLLIKVSLICTFFVLLSGALFISLTKSGFGRKLVFYYTLFNLCQCLTKAFLLQKNILLIWGFLIIGPFITVSFLHVYAFYCVSVLFCSGKSELKVLAMIYNNKNWKWIKILILIHCFVKSLLHP